MTQTKIINETPFSTIPPSVVNDIIEASTGNPLQTATFSSDGIYDWNAQIAKLGRPTIASNNFSTYLQDTATRDSSGFGSIVSSGSEFSFIPSPASYTKGLIDDVDDFKHKFFPDYNDTTDPKKIIRGRFKTETEYNEQTTDPFDGGGYTEFKFKYSTDGVAAPATKKIDNRYFGPSGEVTVNTYEDVESFALPNWIYSTPTILTSGSGFNPDPDASDRGSVPTDSFTQPTITLPTTTSPPTNQTTAPPQN